MAGWEQKIVDAFIDRYFASTAKNGMEERNTLRLRSVSLFPDFDIAVPDEKESYLEAAETLEQKGFLTLNWEKRGKGQRLKTLNCVDMAKLFEASGRRAPKTEAEEIRSLLRASIMDHGPHDFKVFLTYLSEHFGPSEIGRGLDLKAVEDLIKLLDVFYNPAALGSITTRALSISLYHDSKRLEHVIDIFNPLLTRVRKQGIPAPDFSPLQRSLPETKIAGKLIFEYGGDDPPPPLVHASGLMLGFPLPSIQALCSIKTIDAADAPSVLTIENLETFYALADPRNFAQGREQRGELSRFDCFLYTGGYLNQADAGMVKILSDSGFRLYHAGDLDPDGILILQNIMDVTGKPVSPVGMNAAVFDRYLPWGGPLTGSMLGQIKKIRDDTRAVPGIADLIQRIEATGRGVEQEIVDYRGHFSCRE
jgi:hypothetical protein